MIKFYKMIFIMTMMIGTLITISSYSWLSMWMGLEINLLSIIPLLKCKNNKFPSEASFKYFIIQSTASTMLMFSMILNFNLMEQMNNYSNSLINIMFYSSIFMKMGASPFHAWFPEVLEGLSWNKCIIMMTWQKIAPMIILMQNYKFNFLMLLIIISSSFTGSIVGLNQISMRKIMAYSSINHISWMLASMPSTKMIWIIYFLVYSIISLAIISSLNYSKIYFIHQMAFFKMNKIINLVMNINFLSMGGLPPFLGFFPKWLTINFLIWNSNYLVALILIMLTLISLFVYTRIIFSSMMLLNSEMKTLEFIKVNFTIIMINFLTLMGMMICPLMFNYL